MGKITAYSAMSAPASGDLLLAVDVSDTSMASTGTDKKLALSDLGTFLGAGSQPWQFYVGDAAYGAAGDAKIGTGGTGTSGTSTFTDSGASFVNAAAPAGDVGKYIIINQGTSGSGTTNGTTQNPFAGTITAVGSATSVTLSGNLAAACTAAPYVYGTDDAPAIQAAIDAANTWATSNGQMAEVLFGPFAYMLGTLTQSAVTDYNTHLAIPSPGQNGQRLALRLQGTGVPYPPYWEEEQPQLSGTCLVSGVFPPSQPDATYGQMSVIGSKVTQPGGTAFNNTVLSVDEISVIVPWNSQIFGVDGRFIDQLQVPRGLCKPFAPVNVPGASIGGPYLQNIPSNGVSTGYAFPVVNNNAVSNAEWLSVIGMSKGVACSEHAVIAKLTTLYCDTGLYPWPNGGGTGKHGISVGHWCAEGCNTCLDASASTAGTQAINIGLLDGESNNTAHINDPSSVLTGIIYWTDETSSAVTATGAANVTVIDTSRHLPGPWSGAPSAPATTVAQQNTAYRYATIVLSNTTAAVTSISVGPASGTMTVTGLVTTTALPVSVRVPPGHWFKCTYASGTLVTKWFLD